MNYFLTLFAFLLSFASAAHFIESELKASALKGTNYIIGRLKITLSLLDKDPNVALLETYAKYDEDSALIPVHEVPSIRFIYVEMLKAASETEKGELLASARAYSSALLQAYESVKELIMNDSMSADNFYSLIEAHKFSTFKHKKASKALDMVIESLKGSLSLVEHALPKVKRNFISWNMKKSFELLEMETDYSVILEALNDSDKDCAYDHLEESIKMLEQVKSSVDAGEVEYDALYRYLQLGDYFNVPLNASDGVLDFPESAQFYHAYASIPITFEDTEFIKSLLEKLVLNLKLFLNGIESGSEEQVLLHSHFILHRNLMSQSILPREVFVAIIRSDLKKPKKFALAKSLLIEKYENVINALHGELLSIEKLENGEKFTMERDMFWSLLMIWNVLHPHEPIELERFL